MSGLVHISFIPAKDCYNPFDSWGMTCVGCGCCARCKDIDKMYENRITTDLRHFKENATHYNSPEFPEELQQKNIRINAIWLLERIMKSMQVQKYRTIMVITKRR